jgi:hypothetical protein
MALGGRRYEVGIDRGGLRVIPTNFHRPVLFDEIFVNTIRMKEQIVAIYNWVRRNWVIQDTIERFVANVF